MDEFSITSDDNYDDSLKVGDILDKFSQLSYMDKTKLSMDILGQLDEAQKAEIYQFMHPLLGCNLIVALHQAGHVKIVKGILDYLDALSILHLESTCNSIFSIIRIHLCWKSLIEQKIGGDPVWVGIVRRRGWMRFFCISDVRIVKNPDFYRRLYALIHREISVLEMRWKSCDYKVNRIQFNDTNGVYCLQYDDHKIVSGHRDNTVKIWNIQNSCCEKTLVGHFGSVLCIQFDDNRVISGSSDCTIRIWDIRTGKELQKLTAHTQPVLYLRYDDSILVTCSKDSKAIVWANNADVNEPITEVKRLFGHRAAVNVVDFDTEFVVTASGDRSIIVWTRETLTIRNTLVGHKRGIACLHQRGNIVASGSSDKTIRLWDIMEGVCLRVLTGHDDLVRCIRFNDKYIVSGSYDAKIKIWDYKSIMSPGWNSRDHCIATKQEHTGRVFRLMFDDFQIMTCSHDDTIVIWNLFDDNFNQLVDSPFE